MITSNSMAVKRFLRTLVRMVALARRALRLYWSALRRAFRRSDERLSVTLWQSALASIAFALFAVVALVDGIGDLGIHQVKDSTAAIGTRCVSHRFSTTSASPSTATLTR